MIKFVNEEEAKKKNPLDLNRNDVIKVPNVQDLKIEDCVTLTLERIFNPINHRALTSLELKGDIFLRNKNLIVRLTKKTHRDLKKSHHWDADDVIKINTPFGLLDVDFGFTDLSTNFLCFKISDSCSKSLNLI